jgi:hypothetical protein
VGAFGDGHVGDRVQRVHHGPDVADRGGVRVFQVVEPERVVVGVLGARWRAVPQRVHVSQQAMSIEDVGLAGGRWC